MEIPLNEKLTELIKMQGLEMESEDDFKKEKQRYEVFQEMIDHQWGTDRDFRGWYEVARIGDKPAVNYRRITTEEKDEIQKTWWSNTVISAYEYLDRTRQLDETTGVGSYVGTVYIRPAHDFSRNDWYKSDCYYPTVQTILRKKHKGTARQGTSEWYRRMGAMIDIVHKRLIRENITVLKEEGWTFYIEHVRRKNGKTYYYFRRQRRIKETKNKHEREWLDAKDEDDYRNRVLRNQAITEVYRDKVVGWMCEGLTPSENKTLHIITNELLNRKKSYINPIVAYYIKKSGLRVCSKKYRVTEMKIMRLQAKKNMLLSAKKMFKKTLFSAKARAYRKGSIFNC